MNENTAYSIWCEIIKLHKTYAAIPPTDGLGALTRDINIMNSKYNLPFCNALTGILFDWYRVGFTGLPVDRVMGFYKDLWFLHHKYMLVEDRGDDFWNGMFTEVRNLKKKYLFDMFERYIFVICDSVELGNALCTDGVETTNTENVG